jgi:hypothetical protein
VPEAELPELQQVQNQLMQRLIQVVAVAAADIAEHHHLPTAAMVVQVL